MPEHKITLFNRLFNLYILSLIFNVLNLSVYGLILAASVLKFLILEQNVIVITSFSGVASLFLVFSEFYISQMIYDYFRFLVTFRGRGGLLLILGFIVFEKTNLFNVIATYYTVSIGLLYVVISFVPHLLPLNDIKNNLRSYFLYLEELRDPYGTLSNSAMQTRSSRPFENAVSTIRTSAVRDIHTIRSGPEHLKQQNLERVKSGRNTSFKGQATLAMEINAALSELQYSDFATSSGNTSSTSLEQQPPIPPKRSALVTSPLAVITPEDNNPLVHHFTPIIQLESIEVDTEPLSRTPSLQPPPMPPKRKNHLHRASRT